jgi:citrate lyase beta subunit
MQVVPMDTPYLYYKNPDGLKTELAMLRQFGFKGKFAIHPSQVSIINDAFKPLKEEIDYSKALVDEFNKAMADGKAAINFRGTMVDIAAYKRALNIVKEANIKQ